MERIDSNDPRLTAYALGELDTDEADAVRLQLNTNPSLQAEVDEIRRTAKSLSESLAGESAPVLTEVQRRQIEEGPKDVLNQPWIFRARNLWMGAGLAAAASLVFAVMLPQIARSPENEQLALREKAQLSPTKSASEFNNRVAGLDELDAGRRGLASKSSPADQPSPSPELAAAGVEIADRLEAAVDFSWQRSPGKGKKDSDKQGGIAVGADAALVLEESERARNREGVYALTGNGKATSAGMGGGGQAPPAARVSPPAPPPRTTAGRPASEMRRQISDSRTRASEADPDDNAQLGTGFVFQEGDRADFSRENYQLIEDNPFVRAVDQPLSTFSIDVDTASYANVRRFLNAGQLPPPDAVRIEEMVNYFTYNYEPPSGEVPFSAAVEVASAPWKPEHRLVRIGLRGKDVRMDMRPATSLVFLLDVSGSMNDRNKLPLVRESMKLLVDKLNGDDRLAIVTYAGNAGLALDSTFCTDQNKEQIISAIDSLAPGGSTHGSAGIQLAYDVATQDFIKGGVNRVILCTDGDFNVGVSGDGDLTRLIESQRETGVFLSVLGFGTGNFQDAKMEQLANHGNGNFAYIDSIDEARKVLVDQMGGTLVTIAKDVKIQVDFNPGKVAAYRLIGYENRMLAAQDFADDRKDAGEIGAGHTVTALYEVIPAGEEPELPEVPQSDFIAAGKLVESELLMNLKLRYKQPDGDVSEELIFPITDSGAGIEESSADFRFASAVASFGMVLRNSPHKGESSFAGVLDIASPALGEDTKGYRAQFIVLVKQAQIIAGN